MAPLTRTRHRTPRGFTLIEMVVVVVFMGILASVGAYAYIQFNNTSQAADAKERLRSMGTREQLFAHDYGSYTAWPADLPARANDPVVTNADSTGSDQVSVALGDQGSLGMAVRSDARCFYARLASAATTGDLTFVSGSGACNGTAALPAGESPVTPAQVAP